MPNLPTCIAPGCDRTCRACSRIKTAQSRARKKEKSLAYAS